MKSETNKIIEEQESIVKPLGIFLLDLNSILELNKKIKSANKIIIENPIEYFVDKVK